MRFNTLFLHLALTGGLLVAGCKNTPSTTQPLTTDTPAVQGHQADTTPTSSDEMESQYADYYVTIADSGSEYYPLDKLMYAISNSLNVKVDTMGRHYNTTKKRIALPDDHEDEMYRGDYYPRREGNDFLSIEYTVLFDTAASADNMCVVAGLFTTMKSADSALQQIKPIAPRAFVIKASVYEGCLH